MRQKFFSEVLGLVFRSDCSAKIQIEVKNISKDWNSLTPDYSFSNSWISASCSSIQRS
jgi:hypothetical protein